MKRLHTSLLFILLLVLSNNAFSQMVGDNVFLQGAYVEIGIAPNGGYGSTVNAPTGYHPRNPGGITFFDPGAGTSSFLSSNLGFVADYGHDGWTVGTPPYFGDYYLPGTPQEGWAIEINGEESDAYIPSYESDPTTGFTGNLSGTNTLYSNSGGIIKGVWEGLDTTSTGGGKLKIRQTTILDTSKLYFTTNVVLINTGTTTLTNIYYLRTVDPDNEETVAPPTEDGFITINTITDQLPNTGNKVLVSTTGQHYLNAYLGLGTKDCRAKCMIYGGDEASLVPAFKLDIMFNDEPTTEYFYAQGHCDTDDIGIGLDYNIGSLAAGDSTTLTYAYILNATYIDSALNATEPKYVVDNNTYDSVVTINACNYPSDTIPVTLENAGFYNWTWLPNLFIQHPYGVTNSIYSDSLRTFLATIASSSITYTITGTSTSGACSSITYYLTVIDTTYPGPVAPPVTYCQNAVSNPFFAVDSFKKTWWLGPTDTLKAADTPSTLSWGVHYYYVSEKQSSGCSSLRSIDTVTILQMPYAPSISDPNPYCQGQAFVPFITSVPGILWYAGAIGGTGSTTAPTLNTGIPGEYTFYASDTVSDTVVVGLNTMIANCESPRTSITITVKDSLLPSFSSNLYYGCTNDTVVFENTTSGGINYLWNFDDGSTDTAMDPVHVYTIQGVHHITLTAINESCTANSTDSVFIDHHLKAGFTFDPATVCQQLPVNFTDTSIGVKLSYVWNFGTGDTNDSANTSYTYTHAGTYHVTLVVTDFVPCEDTAMATIYVDTQSSVNILLTDTVICQGTYITLSGLYSNDGNVGVTWYLGDGDSIKNENPISYAYNTAGVYTPTVTALYRACQNVETSRKITVVSQPIINLGPDTSICLGSGAITLADNINAENPKATWIWNTGQTTSSILINSPGYYTATVNLNNCSSTDSILVQNDCYMDIPNAFTPNNDGINDDFYPRQLLTKGLTSFTMNIYNRWGQLVFETHSLDGAGWDGKLNNVAQPEGVYIYIIDGTFKDGQKEHHQGNVTLLR